MREQLGMLQTVLHPGAGNWHAIVAIVGILVAAFVVRYVAWRLMRRFFARLAARTASVEEKRRVDTLGKIVRQSVSTLIVVMAAMLVLNELGVSIAPILGAAGVVGIALGFGAQSLVKDYFAGFFLLVEN